MTNPNNASDKAVSAETIKPKPVKERDNADLLELVCQLHSRALRVDTKEMHDAYVEARNEMDLRLSEQSAQAFTAVETNNYGSAFSEAVPNEVLIFKAPAKESQDEIWNDFWEEYQRHGSTLENLQQQFKITRL